MLIYCHFTLLLIVKSPNDLLEYVSDDNGNHTNYLNDGSDKIKWSLAR